MRWFFPVSTVVILAAWVMPLKAMGPEPELVRVDLYLPQVIIDLRYATTNNFTHKVIYKEPYAWLRPDTLRKLRGVVKDLRMKGYRLVIFDAYRPSWAQEKLWEARPDPKFLAAPWEISRHSRGTTVDVGLADLNGNLLEMPSEYDEFNAKADHDFSDIVDEIEVKHGTDLRNAFYKNGFTSVEDEWWHYDLANWADYPVVYRDGVTPEGKAKAKEN
jgi:D-alanyl-D-alanine dipeptidase